MAALAFNKVQHHSFVNAHQHSMVTVVKIVLPQLHHTIHAFNHLVKMVVHVSHKVHHSVANAHQCTMVSVVKIVLQQLHHTTHVFNHLVKMVVLAYHKVHRLFANVHRITMVSVVKIVLLQLHHVIHVFQQLVKMVVHVLQLVAVSDKSIQRYLVLLLFPFQHRFVDAHLATMVLDVKHATIVHPIHVLIMGIVCRHQLVTLVHA